jgi:two-component system, NtrC family, sensor kinase
MSDPSHEALRQAQKIEALGRVASGVAHEINTPVQFVRDSVNFAQEAVRDLLDVLRAYESALDLLPPAEAARVRAIAEDADIPYIVENLPLALERGMDGLQRVAEIVRSLKDFAHPDQDERKPVDLNRSIASTLAIARNEYKLVADLVTNFHDLPPVVCFVGELNQAVLNIVVNAAHAIADRVAGTDQRGTIAVTTRIDDQHVVVIIKDTGGGIPESVRARMFEPFFTTKEAGRGTGQGLAIAKMAVCERNKGTLTFETEMGVGTTFVLRIPIDPTAAELAA